MMQYRYKIKPLAQRKIRSFYYNVAKKYRHTYSKWLMHKNIDDAVDAMPIPTSGTMPTPLTEKQ